MFAKLCVLLAVVAVASAQNVVQTVPCPGETPPLLFTSDDCTAAGLCTLRRDQIFTGQATFLTANEITSATVQVAATILSIPFPMPIPDGYERVCDFLVGSTCPLAAGTTHIWGIQFPITNTLPLVNGINIRSKLT